MLPPPEIRSSARGRHLQTRLQATADALCRGMVNGCTWIQSRQCLAVSLQEVPVLWPNKGLEARQQVHGLGCLQQGQHPLNQCCCVPCLLVLPQQGLHLPASCTDLMTMRFFPWPVT